MPYEIGLGSGNVITQVFDKIPKRFSKSHKDLLERFGNGVHLML